MTRHQLAQVNIGRINAGLADPVMAGFVTRLDEINALADNSPGFVWRLQTSEGNATYFRPYDDDRILLNMSVWETMDALKQYVYHTAHAELLRQREQWSSGSPVRSWRCGGSRWATFPALMRPRSGWRTLRSAVQR